LGEDLSNERSGDRHPVRDDSKKPLREQLHTAGPAQKGVSESRTPATILLRSTPGSRRWTTVGGRLFDFVRRRGFVGVPRAVRSTRLPTRTARPRLSTFFCTLPKPLDEACARDCRIRPSRRRPHAVGVRIPTADSMDR
jgi:hypothetical protein